MRKMLRMVYLSSALVFFSLLASAQRLPGNVVPEHYQLTFTPDLHNATFAGEETIEAGVLTSTNAVILNAAELVLQEATLVQEGKTQSAKIALDAAKEQAVLTVSDPLHPGAVRLHIRFTGVLNNQLRGFYMSHSGGLKYAVTQFESTYARRAFPCFDEPAFKATFDVTLVLHKDDTGISNGRIISDTPGPADKHTVVFSTTAKMSSYLVAVAVGKFACSEGQVDGIAVRVCGQPARKPSSQLALRYAQEVLGYLNRYHEIKYPFGKLDIVGVPDLEPSAMENAGAIFCRENIFADEQGSSLELRKSAFETLAHEIAHQWFGNMVTMRWWDDLWLNEGFATWMASKLTRELHPEWNTAAEAVWENDGALNTDALKSTHPLKSTAETADEIYSLFDQISYLKGAALLRMIESSVGADVFRKGINSYLRKFAYANSTAENFWQTMTEVCAAPIDRMMTAFVRHAGEPLVSVQAACRKGKTEITLSQQRFWDDPKAGAGDARDARDTNDLWTIPICLKTATGKPNCQLLSQRQQVTTINGCSSWIMVHPDGSGYYRAAYQPDNLDKLIAAAMTVLTPTERVSLLSDTWALVKAGRQNVADYLKLVTALSQDRDPAVMASYKGPLTVIHDYLLATSDREAFHAWVRATFNPLMVKTVVANTGGKSSESQNEATASMRADLIEILGKLGEDPEVIRDCRRSVEMYLLAPNLVDPVTAHSMVAVAAHFGDDALFRKFNERIRSYRSVEQYFNLMMAMPEFRDPNLTERWLETCASPEISSLTTVYCISNLLYSPASRAATWAWVKKQWPKVEAKITMTNGADIVRATQAFCDTASRDDVQQFFTTHKSFSAERALQQSLERIDACIRNRNQQQGALTVWLNHQSQSGSPANKQ